MKAALRDKVKRHFHEMVFFLHSERIKSLLPYPHPSPQTNVTFYILSPQVFLQLQTTLTGFGGGGGGGLTALKTIVRNELNC